MKNRINYSQPLWVGLPIQSDAIWNPRHQSGPKSHQLDEIGKRGRALQGCYYAAQPFENLSRPPSRRNLRGGFRDAGCPAYTANGRRAASAGGRRRQQPVVAAGLPRRRNHDLNRLVRSADGLSVFPPAFGLIADRDRPTSSLIRKSPGPPGLFLRAEMLS